MKPATPVIKTGFIDAPSLTATPDHFRPATEKTRALAHSRVGLQALRRRLGTAAEGGALD